MNIKNKIRNYGFTIVELLVVIVIIGILATITIVSFNGVSNRAIVASIKSDLVGASKQLAIHFVEKGEYPASIVSCPIPTEGNICVKSSSGNGLLYTPAEGLRPQTYSLTASKGAISYYITNTTTPTVTPASIPISATGGVITNPDTNTTLHTFNSNGTFSITAGSGAVTVNIKAGGGGGGACYISAGGAGGLSSIKLGINTPYVAYGGGGGEDGYGDAASDNSPGLTDSNGLTGITGGALNGGAGASYDCGDGNGENGGHGGRVYGNITMTSGQSYTILVGVAGTGGDGAGNYTNGSPGGSGIVTFTYSN